MSLGIQSAITPERGQNWPNGQLSFCKNCGAHCNAGTRICGNCGAVLDAAILPPALLPLKKARVSLLLAGFLGVFFMGIGHVYLRRMGRGIVILFSGVLTGVLFYSSMVTAFFSIGIVFGVVRLFLWIWQIYDAHKLTKRYNSVLESTGKAPW
jgi:TM2 domain-containing membrane protein YozV